MDSVQQVVSTLADLATIGAFILSVWCYINKCSQRKNHSSDDK
ncbi:hypothetical protein [Intestinibacter bartlettii]|nr:hypothetical protein [Intestinibacter bartlettii]